MKTIIYLCCLLLISASRTPLKILILGDSLTDGFGVATAQAFPALLEQELKKQYSNIKVVNGGSSGATTSSGLSRLRWYIKSKPTHLILALGSNDGLRGLDVKTSSRNLENIIQKAQSANIKVILAGLQIPPNYGPKYTNSFKKMIPALAKKYRLPFIPFLLDGVAGVPQNNQIDGIHPNEAGHQIITQNILLILNKNL